MNLLHIDSSPRKDSSNSRRLSRYLAESLKPDGVRYRDLACQPLPAIDAPDLVNLHGGNRSDSPGFQRHLALSDELIAELKWADTLIIGTPVHNFGVPVALKQWIDHVCRAGETFRYTENGPAGLTAIDTAYLVVASGGTPINGDMDFVSPYLSHICRFIGVSEIRIVDASGSKRKPEEVIAHGREQIDRLAEAA